MSFTNVIKLKNVYRLVFCLLTYTFTCPLSFASNPHDYFKQNIDGADGLHPSERPPIPPMPSDLFQRMALSQLEVLANSLTQPDAPMESKVESMALYVPQENVQTGQLEFTPIVLHPDPKSERVFISYDAETGKAPTLPRALTKLPGFAHATSLLPGYPMISSPAESIPGVGVVEEVMCDPRFKYAPPALSVPLLSGSQTVGVLLVSAYTEPSKDDFWSEQDRHQVSCAAQSLSMALTMDNERSLLREQNDAFREGLSDSLHQVKNPLQALRTYGKILQRHIADIESSENTGGSPQLFELVERLMDQSERVVDLMIPMDSLVDSLDQQGPYMLNPAKRDTASQSLVLWGRSTSSSPIFPANETIEVRNNNGTLTEFFPPSRNLNSPKHGVVNQTEPKKERHSVPATTPHLKIVGDTDTAMTFVTDALDPIFSAFHAIAAERRIGFEVRQESSELPGVMAAPRSLQEAVSNLLDNAVKYVVLPKAGSPFSCNPSPLVRVKVLANSNPAGVTILVEDNGPGIRRGEAGDIFKRGFRGELTKAVEGSGIGLDISQALVRRMGGDLVLLENHDERFQNCLDGTVIALTLYRD